MNNKDKEFLNNALKILGKENCQKTAGTLQRAFSLRDVDGLPQFFDSLYSAYQNKQITDVELSESIQDYYLTCPTEIQALSGLTVYAHQALDDLNWVTPGNQIEYIREFSSNPIKMDKVKKLQRYLSKALNQFQDKDINEYLRLMTLEDSEKNFSSNRSIYRRGYDNLLSLHNDLERFIARSKKKQGRPSFQNFYEFVYQVAILYEDLSGENFTSDLHKDDEEYNPITKGMEFVWSIVDWLHREAHESRGITDHFQTETVAHACEAARTKLKAERTQKK